MKKLRDIEYDLFGRPSAAGVHCRCGRKGAASLLIGGMRHKPYTIVFQHMMRGGTAIYHERSITLAEARKIFGNLVVQNSP